MLSFHIFILLTHQRSPQGLPLFFGRIKRWVLPQPRPFIFLNFQFLFLFHQLFQDYE